ncbi:aminotransferase class IV [Sinorhizobium medicae]|uniref:aminotransferase class IV n=1 Tax=Sinorhizobium medicae TaxID=110321 RepID=UPI0027DDD939|nr:aminotransferase class IV [Sinorhizobium medicae]
MPISPPCRFETARSGEWIFTWRACGQPRWISSGRLSRRLSEATIWNLVYWDGEAVVWPEAAVLAGVTMGVVSRQLKRLGIPQRREEITLENLKHLQGAAVMNSWTPGVPVTTIGQVVLPEAKPFIELLHKAYIAEPALSI